MKNQTLYSEKIDFALLGGGSLLLLLLIRTLLPPNADSIDFSFAATIFFANFINHPHFAISYFIFYSDFNKKTSNQYIQSLRIRYISIGIVAPIAIIAYIWWLIYCKNYNALGLLANAMFFLVGWHYVKQGYGMLMLQSSLKKQFFNDQEKNAFLRNAYAAWIFSWLLINYIAAGKSPQYFGIPYLAFHIPAWILTISGIVSTAYTMQWLFIIYKRHKAKEAIVWNGIIAYSTSLYAWLLIRDPIVILWVPLFHSLQYLAVTWRFQLNKYRSNISPSIHYRYKFAAFLSMTFIFGYLFFFHIPMWLDRNISYDHEIFGHTLFMFLFWIFINIHHYLIDTVMWRKGNPDVQKYLFNTNIN